MAASTMVSVPSWHSSDSFLQQVEEHLIEINAHIACVEEHLLWNKAVVEDYKAKTAKLESHVKSQTATPPCSANFAQQNKDLEFRISELTEEPAYPRQKAAALQDENTSSKDGGVRLIDKENRSSDNNVNLKAEVTRLTSENICLKNENTCLANWITRLSNENTRLKNGDQLHDTSANPRLAGKDRRSNKRPLSEALGADRDIDLLQRPSKEKKSTAFSVNPKPTVQFSISPIPEKRIALVGKLRAQPQMHKEKP